MSEQDLEDQDYSKHKCEECNGTGKIMFGLSCLDCGGSGKVDWIDRLTYKDPKRSKLIRPIKINRTNSTGPR